MKVDSKEYHKLIVRPTVVISTISPSGISNAAPYSWSSPLATRPRPLFGFSSNVNNDTWANVAKNKDFVVNLVGKEFGPLMEIMEKDFPYEVSEIGECGLTEVASNQVEPPRIKEAYGWLECRMTEYIPLSERNIWIIGEVLEAEVKDEAFHGVVDVRKVDPLSHIWGEFFITNMKMTKFRRI